MSENAIVLKQECSDIKIPDFRQVLKGSYDGKFKREVAEIENLITDRFCNLFNEKIKISYIQEDLISFQFSKHPLEIRKIIINPSIMMDIININFTFFEKRMNTRLCLAEVFVSTIELFIVNYLSSKYKFMLDSQLFHLLEDGSRYSHISRTELEDSLKESLSSIIFENPANYEIYGYKYFNFMSKKRIISTMKIFSKSIYNELSKMISPARLDTSSLKGIMNK